MNDIGLQKINSFENSFPPGAMRKDFQMIRMKYMQPSMKG